MPEIKLPFGLNQNNILVHITDVKSGKDCGCICPSCHSLLIAAKGNRKQHHFKHAVDHECKSGLESAIHLAAKQIIMERKQITLPECISMVTMTDSKNIEHTEEELVVSDGTIIHFDTVQDEVELHGMKADILATVNNKQLIIEIFYRHKVDDQKWIKMIKADVSAIEINLSDLKHEDVKDWDNFWSCLNDHCRVQWLYNVKADHIIYKKLEIKLEEKIQIQERKYKQEEAKKQKQELREKKQFEQAIEALKLLSSKERIFQLKQRAEKNPVWKRTSKYLEFAWQDLPEFLDAEVPDGDWIFGCDRRIWQTAFYNYFVCRKGKAFTIRAVDDWLQNTVGCKVPDAVKTVGMIGSKHPKFIPREFAGNLPSSWRTLRVYFHYLCKLEILRYSGDDWHYPGSYWFQVEKKEDMCNL